MDKKLKIATLIMSLVLYQLLFWKEGLGFNIFIYFVYILFMMVVNHHGVIRSRYALITGISTLIIAGMVVIFNSGTSKLSFFVSLSIFTGFVFQPEIRSAMAALPTAVVNFFLAPKQFANDFTKAFSGRETRKTRPGTRLKLLLIPLLVLLVFYFIFMGANPVFKNLNLNFFEHLNTFLGKLFRDFSWTWLLFISLGMFCLMGIFYNAGYRKFVTADLAARDDIRRKRRNILSNLSLKLRDENRVGVLMIISVNILLMIVNIIDIHWIWFGFDPYAINNLSQFVHEGTYLLILSILLSMAILLYFFRGNQNFYSKSKWLRIGAYIWIAQNIILSVSVAIRNYHYISFHGLAYKRLGVIIFLILVVFGLLMLFFKIKNKRSAYFLLRTNTWAVYVVLILMSLVNWDVFIARYNLTKEYPANIDYIYLETLSDKALHVIYEYKDKLDDQFSSESHKNSFDYYMKWRLAHFKHKKCSRTLMSWNYAEYKTLKYFENEFEIEE